MSDPDKPDDLDALLREHGGIEGLARELGQLPDSGRGMTDEQFKTLIGYLRAILIVCTAPTTYS